MQEYRTDYQTHYYGNDYYSSYNYDYRKIMSNLHELRNVLTNYDRLREKLEKEGGNLDTLKHLNYCLTKKIVIDRNYPRDCSLTEISSIINWLDDYNIYLDVRRMEDTGLPIYLLARASETNDKIIIETFYQSKGYPVIDRRYLKLVHFGKERHFINMSVFRKSAKEIYKLDDNEIDELLVKIANLYFIPCWHIDQRIPFLISDMFKLKYFKSALELLYLILLGDLSTIRSNYNSEINVFFKLVYPQKAINRLSKKLNTLNGDGLVDLNRKALIHYKNLQKIFNQLLILDVNNGQFYKYLFANLFNPDVLKTGIKNKSAINAKVKQLDNISMNIIKEFI
ncbi:MAG: hypothetical protein HOF35_04160 [Bacteroidetes bacterium]|jgi:hypothetical protein|nr:hypothetical protein [Bacteroidota bacterium]